MTKIVPLLEEGATDLERILLRSAEEDLAVAPGARERTMAVVTAAANVPLVVKPSLVAKWVGPALVNWLAGGAVTVALVGGALNVGMHVTGTHVAAGALGSQETQVRSTLPKNARGTAGAEIAPPRSPVDAVPPPAATFAAPAAPDGVRVRPSEIVRKSPALDAMQRTAPPRPELATPSVDEDSLRAEAQLLETAREQLARSRPADALATLDHYDARYAKGTLAPEAAVLRIQVLIRSGDRASASVLADDFARTHPASPYVARVRSLLSNPP
jgi:hypothetical protein